MYMRSKGRKLIKGLSLEGRKAEDRSRKLGIEHTAVYSLNSDIGHPTSEIKHPALLSKQPFSFLCFCTHNKFQSPAFHNIFMIENEFIIQNSI